MKITFMGAGSTAFVKNVLGDTMLCPSLQNAEFALYDIDAQRLKDSQLVIEAMNHSFNESRAKVVSYLGVENRKNALQGADFVICAIQVGGYEPCTVIDFEIPRKYGLRQTIGDTLGIGGIFRALRTIPVLRDFAADMEEVCPNAWLLNYTNPMAMLTGYLQRHTGIKMIGLCHSVQVCATSILHKVGMDEYMDNHIAQIAGINHMAWLLKLTDKQGNDLYPEVRRRAKEKSATVKHKDMVRFDYIDKLGYFCTESSEHNAEYNPFYIKPGYPELIDRFNIPLDEYPRRCIEQIKDWKQLGEKLLSDPDLSHNRSREYASYIMEAIVTGKPYAIGGNVLNTGRLIEDFPEQACVEVPCLVDGMGIHPTYVGYLPPVLAAMNMTNINTQLLTIEAAVTKKKEHIYQAAMLDPHTSSELSIDDIVAMCDEMIEAHKGWLPEYH